MYFCTFTCFNWINLIEQTNSYDLVYNWFAILKEKSVDVIAYVIMPNHVHCILNFQNDKFNLNYTLSNGKRFMAYKIVERLQENKEKSTLKILEDGLTLREKNKGSKHKVFKDSFDANPIISEKFLRQKLNYIHFNPVTGKWNLAADFTLYDHSSASFYENGFSKFFKPRHFMDV
ncbi:MAG: transposase [Ginsengibacter sp.]